MRRFGWLCLGILSAGMAYQISLGGSDIDIASTEETRSLLGAAVQCKNATDEKDGCGEIIDGSSKKCDASGKIWSLDGTGTQKETASYCNASKPKAGTCGVYDTLSDCK
jgi:hypothetical protein